MSGDPSSLITYPADFAQTRVTIYMGFVSFMILVWDHIITLDDEINYIWKGRKGPIVWLFFLNRYLSPLGFIINLFAYMSPTWTPERCHHFVRYEGSMTVIGLNTAALMMLLRVYAMYPSNFYVVGFVFVVFIVELSVNAWLLTHGIAVTHDTGIHACTMIFDNNVPAHLASASAWLPLTYDTIVLILTLNRTLKPVRHQAAGKIMKVLLRDGLMYYSVIFSVNLVLTLMIALAPAGIQNITAQLEYLLTVAMMSRITLHLKKQGRLPEIIDWDSGAVYTFRGGITSTIHGLRFTRSHRSDAHGLDATVNSHHYPPAQVTVTIDEFVTHDRDEDVHGRTFLDLSDSEDTREPSIQDCHLKSQDVKKPVEWHEMDTVTQTSIKGSMV